MSRAGPGPENPGPRASPAKTGLKIVLFNSALCKLKFQIFVNYLQVLLKISLTSKFFFKDCQNC